MFGFTRKYKVEVFENGEALVHVYRDRGGLKRFRSLSEAEEYIRKLRDPTADNRVTQVLHL